MTLDEPRAVCYYKLVELGNREPGAVEAALGFLFPETDQEIFSCSFFVKATSQSLIRKLAFE